MEVKSNSAGALYSKSSIDNTVNGEKLEKTWEFQENQGSTSSEKDEGQVDPVEKRSDSQGVVEEDSRDDSFGLNLEVSKETHLVILLF